ncbi:TetR-like C-terminal domain-containing protein [Nocardia sp. NPDC020380]|uniref:TetR-like C-terminal domain-containing protein n=1 Tax=Nocardia sp. NPDC020380 TaxID=3364309 RepID=UPI00379C5F02
MTRDPAFAQLKKALYEAGSGGFRSLLDTARTRGDLPPGTDIDLVIDQLAGPLVFRKLLAGRDFDASFVEAVVDGVCRFHGVGNKAE